MRPAISTAIRSACALGAVGVMLLLPARPASANLAIDVKADDATAGLGTSTDTAIHGRARTTIFPDSEEAFVAPGPGGPCLFPLGEPGAGCAFLGQDVSQAVGEIFAPEGRFRARALAPGAPAQVVLQLDDTLILSGGPLAFDFHLSAGLDAFSTFTFAAALQGPEFCVPGLGCDTLFFPIFEVQRTVTSGHEDLFIEQHVTIAPDNLACLFLPAACNPTPGAELPWVVRLSASAESEGAVHAESTVFIGVEGAQSASGHSYPFRVEPSAPVPAPSTALLLVGGLAVLWARARRK